MQKIQNEPFVKQNIQRMVEYSETVFVLQGILSSGFKLVTCPHLVNTELDCTCNVFIF